MNFKTSKKPQPSIHNTVLNKENSRASLKLFKTGDKEYQLECFRSISGIIGLAFAYTSFVFKFVTQ